MYTQRLGGAWALRLGAVVYVVGAVSAWRVRAVGPALEPVDREAFVELVRPDVSSAVWDMVVLRAAIGFALFQFGFSLRAEGDPAWVLGGLILANGFGGFTGTVVSPWLRRHTNERSMFTAALVGSAVVALAAGMVLSRVDARRRDLRARACRSSVGRRALDATIQQQAPRAGAARCTPASRRDSSSRGSAPRASPSRSGPRRTIGMLALAMFLGLVAIIHLRRREGLLTVRPLGARAARRTDCSSGPTCSPHITSTTRRS